MGARSLQAKDVPASEFSKILLDVEDGMLFPWGPGTKPESRECQNPAGYWHARDHGRNGKAALVTT